MGESTFGVGREKGEIVVRHIDVEKIDPGRFQTRKQFNPETLEELAQSIRTSGVIQPVVVRHIVRIGRYELIAGERRWRASQLAGEYSIPALVRDDMEDEACLVFAIAENIQRDSLNSIEEAASFQRLSDDLGMFHEDIAKAVGKSRTYVTNTVRLLKLESGIQEMIVSGAISPGHGKAILGAPSAFRPTLAKQISRYRLSVRKAEERAAAMARDWKGEGDVLPARDPNLACLERRLSDHFGHTVRVDFKEEEGKGGILISFNSLEEAQGILERMRLDAEGD
ncbi:MAG: ParB/RepB/Spo0J family partition protein [Pseudomonadota bacterium]|nr:ParB/RepB/Spo0J family partition protein [Pseudomonadota bacterium]